MVAEMPNLSLRSSPGLRMLQSRRVVRHKCTQSLTLTAGHMGLRAWRWSHEAKHYWVNLHINKRKVVKQKTNILKQKHPFKKIKIKNFFIVITTSYKAIMT